jgi:cell division protein FtsN
MTPQSQHGGTLLGLIIGLVVGLGLALAVAVYVTKVPTPFSNKNQPRTSAQDVQEAEKNKNWNPNGVLQPKLPAEQPVQAVVPATNDNAPRSPTTPPAVGSGPSVLAPAVSADPLGDWVKSQTGQGQLAAPDQASDPFVYMVQVGAYRNRSDADALKAKLALLGMDATVSERDQAGRVVYRVRLGPFNQKNEAESLRVQLQRNNFENTLVRIQR